jgi:hypothetical protein
MDVDESLRKPHKKIDQDEDPKKQYATVWSIFGLFLLGKTESRDWLTFLVIASMAILPFSEDLSSSHSEFGNSIGMIMMHSGTPSRASTYSR